MGMLFVNVITIVIAVILVALIAVGGLRWRDYREDSAAWESLAAHQPRNPALFDPSVIESLPGPAQRFFSFRDPGRRAALHGRRIAHARRVCAWQQNQTELCGNAR